MKGDYLKTTKHFSYGVLAVLPLLAIYEIGLWQGMLGEHVNGADAIFRLTLQFLAAMFGLRWSTWLVAGAVGGLAVGFLWYLTKKRVKISPWYLLLMFLEAAVTGVVLAILVYLILGRKLPHFFVFQSNAGVTRQLALQGLSSPWAKVVAAVGAGVFEELLFRVLLLAGLYGLFAKRGRMLGDDGVATAQATLISSAVFALLHLGSASVGGLVSIFFTSVLLSGVYLARGYGITALAHTAFDLYLMFGVVA
ncbi:MAG: CPBP family intramembrane metalloprotease [Patescibacteria group bacterium]|nr:CPBP family intramembrane metalloprotease [Patescibacteria group bacterium]